MEAQADVQTTDYLNSERAKMHQVAGSLTLEEADDIRNPVWQTLLQRVPSLFRAMTGREQSKHFNRETESFLMNYLTRGMMRIGNK